jgi:acyl-CoA thioester hydrolase
MSLQHELRIRVRYSETDQMGVVHHSSYLVYLEEGRTALMRALGFPYDQVERSGCAMGVRQLDVRYRQAARYGDEILVRTRLERMRGASILYDYEVTRVADGAVLLTGQVETVSLDRDSLRPTPLPDSIAATIEAARGAGSST